MSGGAVDSEAHRFRDSEPVVIGLPRGGVPVGFEVARALAAPLDVLLVRKLGAPFNPEYGIGAIAEGGLRFVCWERRHRHRRHRGRRRPRAEGARGVTGDPRRTGRASGDRRTPR